MTDMDYMRRAISLARLGEGWTNPNPMVGAVVVKNGRVIGEGYHRRCGELHAERNALAACTEDPAGGDHICDPGALLPSGQNAPLHGDHPGKEPGPGGDRLPGSEPEGGG